MKDSGIPWIGEIPSHWYVARLKDIKANKPYAIVDGPFGSAISTNDYREEGIPLVRIVNLVGKYVDSTSTVHIAPELANTIRRSAFGLQDIIFAKTGATVGKCSINNSIDFGILSSSCIKISLSEDLDNRFFYYLFFTNQFNLALRLACGGSTRDTINLTPFGTLPCVIPPFSEQRGIADLLDKKCGEIDEMVSLQEKIIEELKAYKQSVITEAVTKGLNPDVLMQDSGIEWLGQIPERWRISKIKYICKVNGRIGFKGYTKEDLVAEGEGALTIGGKHITENRLNLSNAEFISWNKYYESPEIMVKKGDIVMAQRGSLGKAALIREDIGEATINPSLVLLNGISIDSRFLSWYLISSSVQTLIDLLNTATAVPMISQYQIDNMPLPLPTNNEQQAIADYLDAKCAEIDALISLKQAKIEALKEYKKTIIYEYVTGKKEVK